MATTKRGTGRRISEGDVKDAGVAGGEGHASGSETSFRARLQPDGTALNWVIARVPPGVVEGWAKRRRLRVRGTVNAVAFRTSLFPNRDGRPGYFLLVNKQLQRAAGVAVGEPVEVVLAPDLEERAAALPPELVRAFEGDRTLRRWAEGLSESMRRDIGRWMAGVKGEEAQARRVAQMAERLLQAMEGERSTPPVLERIFARSPRARAAWEALTPVQRRGHLLGIFYYRTPEARERRAEKAIGEALRGMGSK